MPHLPFWLISPFRGHLRTTATRWLRHFSQTRAAVLLSICRLELASRPTSPEISRQVDLSLRRPPPVLLTWSQIGMRLVWIRRSRSGRGGLIECQSKFVQPTLKSLRHRYPLTACVVSLNL